jgi:hypothetical protein
MMSSESSPPTPQLDRHSGNAVRQGTLTEIVVKLTVNGVLLAAAVSTSIKLLPYYFSQQAKLREINIEVSQTQQRVNLIRENFNRNFAPEQTKIVMQEQSSRIESNEFRVFWLNQKATKAR